MSFASTIAELTQQQGRDAAEARRDAARIAAHALTSNAEAASRSSAAKGVIWGNAISNIGNSIAQIPQEINRGKMLDLQTKEMESQVEQRKAQADKLKRQESEDEAIDRAFQESRRPDGTVDLQMFSSKIPGSAAARVLPVVQKVNEAAESDKKNKESTAAHAFFSAYKGGTPAALVTAAKLGSSAGAMTPEDVQQIQQLAGAIAQGPPEAQEGSTRALAAHLGAHFPQFQDLLDADTGKQAGLKKTQAETEAAQSLTAQRSRPPEPKEISVAPGHTVLRDGQPVYTAPEKEPTPARPAAFTLSPGETRYDETGKPIASRPPKPDKPEKPANARPVLSSDANKIAEIDTGLKQAAELKKSLDAPGGTGTLASIEAWLPNFVNEATGGISSEAKIRNAQIALVRQIIGKGLEGGVLRKEDEIKYKAILPTISDAPEVVKSKLEQLDATLKSKRQSHLESLEDAGFNVERLKARQPAADTPKAGKVGKYTFTVE